jgi:hypothetical protein
MLGLVRSAASTVTGCYLSVPFHYQETGYYCGPASLEMVFGFFGPDVPQIEIADAACTSKYGGTGLYDMVRAAHFSSLGTSAGDELPWNIRGYSTRGLGYAAFARSSLTIDELKSLIASGYPIIVAMQYSREWTEGHYRVVVGYNETHMAFHDPWFNSPYEGPNVNVSYSEFLYLWRIFDNWGLCVSPWNVSIATPDNLERDDVFNVTATINYPCPIPFSTDENPASSLNATITLPEGLELLPGETSKKPIGSSYLYPRSSVAVSWAVRANEEGDKPISVESEGRLFGSIPYAYEDRIGAHSNKTIHVSSPVIPEFPPSLLLSLCMATSLLATIVDEESKRRRTCARCHVKTAFQHAITNDHGDGGKLFSEIQILNQPTPPFISIMLSAH